MLITEKGVQFNLGIVRQKAFYCDTSFIPEQEIRMASSPGDIVVSEISDQQGHFFANLPVCSPKMLMNLVHKPQVIVLVGDYERVREKLRLWGFVEHVDFTSAHRVCGNRERILFISHELSYTGAPRSMLRMCKVARKLGYEPIVWSMREGVFRNEYEKEGFDVEVVRDNEVYAPQRLAVLQTCKMVVCNTALTYKFVEGYERLLPLVWYIRESEEDIRLCLRKTGFQEVIRNTRALCTVSEYTAAYLRPIADYSPIIIPNCVEDKRDMALPYQPGTGEKVKFVLMGTISPRKGQDVLIAAYKSLPKQYKYKCEVYFAGQNVMSAFKEYTEKFLQEVNSESGLHYLGLIREEKEKFELLSSMDIVTVLSRDDPCPLSLLEGIMIGRAVIVTENVGGKYLVHDDNGCVVNTGDISSTRLAMIRLIEGKGKLDEMGRKSRYYYEQQANMDFYEREMEKLYKCRARE